MCVKLTPKDDDDDDYDDDDYDDDDYDDDDYDDDLQLHGAAALAHAPA